jgi:PAS domain S-box-containing protein
LRSRIWHLEQTQRQQGRCEVQAHDHYRPLYQHCPLPYQLLDPEGHLLEVNEAWLQALGYERHEVLGRWFGDFMPEADQSAFRERFPRFKESGKIKDLPLELLDRHGRSIIVEFNGNGVYTASQDFLNSHCLFHDVTQRILAEKSLALTNRILQAGQQNEDLHSICDRAVQGIRDLFRCDCVGIRLLDRQGTIPYEAYEGFPRSFYDQESPLSVERDHCMCIEVIKGRLDPTLPFATLYGSFFMNGTTRFLATVSEEDKGQTRNVCNQYGYESVALIPIRDKDDIFGLIHVADTREHRVPYERVQIAETVALQLGTIIRRVRSEEQLIMKEATERALLDATTESAILIDKEATILAINAVGASRLNRRSDELIGVCAYDLLPPDLADNRKQKLMEVVRTGHPVAFKDVRAGRFIYQRLCPVLSEDGTVERVAIFAQDVTELQRQEEAYRDLVDHSLQGLVIVQDYRIVFANHAFADMLGYTVEDVLTSPAMDIAPLVHPDDRSMLEMRHHTRLAGKDVPPVYQVRALHKSGSLRWIKLFISRIDYQGKPAIQAACTDVTDFKRTEKALKESEEFLSTIYENSDIGMFVVSVDETHSYVYEGVNRAHERLFGIKSEEIVGKTPRDLEGVIGNEIVDHIYCIYDVCVTTKHVHESEYNILMKGRHEWWLTRLTPLLDAQGKVYRIVGNAINITERKQFEEALQQSEERSDLAQKASQTGVWERDLRTDEVFWSTHVEILFGMTPQAFGRTYEAFLDRLLPDDRIRIDQEISTAIQQECGFKTQYRICLPDGRIRWMAEHAEIFKDAQGQATRLVGTVCDITDHREMEQRYQMLFTRMLDGFATHEIILDDQGHPADYRFLDVNPAFENLTGLQGKDIIGRTVLEVMPETEMHWIQTYGRVVMTGQPVRFDHFSQALNKHFEVVAFRTQLNQFACIFVDITDRKQAEVWVLHYQNQLKSLASELVLAEEQERNRIAVHLHDDVCQCLAFSKLKLQMLNQTLSDQMQLDEMAEVIDTLTRMLKEIRSLTFELSSPVLAEFGFEAAVSHWLKEEIEQKHNLRTEFSDNREPKPLNKNIQALLFRSTREVLTNAVKYSRANRVMVTIYREGHQIVTRIEDDGIGFAPNKVVVGKYNKGFGLFSIRERMIQFGGSLEIDSHPGQGCRCVLRAPLLEPLPTPR